jgi:hypothetical protein
MWTQGIWIEGNIKLSSFFCYMSKVYLYIGHGKGIMFWELRCKVM